MNETQATISAWAGGTFGTASSNLRVAVRANEEMAELLQALAGGDDYPAGEEIADVVIVLYRLADRMGLDLHEEIDRKMEINRDKRTWEVDASGCGYHVGERDA